MLVCWDGGPDGTSRPPAGTLGRMEGHCAPRLLEPRVNTPAGLCTEGTDWRAPGAPALAPQHVTATMGAAWLPSRRPSHPKAPKPKEPGEAGPAAPSSEAGSCRALPVTEGQRLLEQGGLDHQPLLRGPTAPRALRFRRDCDMNEAYLRAKNMAKD